MNNILKAAIVVSGAIVLSPKVIADMSANIGFTNTYISRGISLSNDNPSLSAGLHYTHKIGFFTGFRAYSLGGAEPYDEVDGYAGYTKQLANGFGFDVSVLTYQFINSSVFDNFEELSLKGRYGIIEVEGVYGITSTAKGNMYFSVSANKSLTDEVSIGATIGKSNSVSKNDPSDIFDYNHVQVSASWKDFTLAVDHNDNEIFDVETTASLTWRKYFGF